VIFIFHSKSLPNYSQSKRGESDEMGFFQATAKMLKFLEFVNGGGEQLHRVKIHLGLWIG
jgi:hypothetical protein